ncbi:MAG: tRNA (adenosine(37)-N6)-dimethylallyltransferase MiaA [Ignavibacteriales bacterium]|nr:tRNA (adenosine(37)-N6)-dimethylallyltransferase MiaA [Ignavibacteriales bacterium]
MKNRTILAVVGPTASGKTALALSLAEMLDGEIVSADSRQIFKYLDVGTAKPTVAEREQVPHHFIDILDPRETYSAGKYGEDVKRVLQGVFQRGHTPILVGGSGLYVKAAIDGIFDGPESDPEIRAGLEERLSTHGLEALLVELKRVDPNALAQMKEITARRVVRALEVFTIAGRPLSELHAEQIRAVDFGTLQVSLKWDRSDLYARVNSRVDVMMDAGLVNEVRALRAMGLDRNLNALNTVGYKEVFDHLEGITDFERMIEVIKQNSRRFAKRQVTWFAADKRIHEFPMSGRGDVVVVARKIVDLYSGTRKS